MESEMDEVLRVLLVEDVPEDARLVQALLTATRRQYRVTCVGTLGECLRRLADEDWDVILLDLLLPDSCGMATVELVQQAAPDVPLVVITASDDKTMALETLRKGAQDYLTKLDVDGRLMDRAIRYACERKRIERKMRDLMAKLETANTKLARLAAVDGLTGLANRRHFDDALQHEWRRSMREETALALVMIDVDQFKAYNDGYGHLAGDDCLRRIALLLADQFQRPGDLAARYGGEEFAVLLPATDEPGASRLAERFRVAIAHERIPHAHSRVADHVTVSVGATATVARTDASPADFVRAADGALYHAKAQGRNRTVLASADFPPASSGSAHFVEVGANQILKVAAARNDHFAPTAIARGARS